MAHTFTLPFFGLGWLKPLHDHKVEICKEKYSTGLADLHTLHSAAVLLPFDGQQGPGQDAYVLSLFLEGHLMSGELQILCPVGGGSAQVCRDAGLLLGTRRLGVHAAEEREARLTYAVSILPAFCLLLNGVK